MSRYGPASTLEEDGQAREVIGTQVSTALVVAPF